MDMFLLTNKIRASCKGKVTWYPTEEVCCTVSIPYLCEMHISHSVCWFLVAPVQICSNNFYEHFLGFFSLVTGLNSEKCEI